MTGTGPNQGTDPIAQGFWGFPNLFGDGVDIYASLKGDGTMMSPQLLDGQWNTDHNGLSIPPAAVFFALTKMVNGQVITYEFRFNFSSTPIVGQYDFRGTQTVYSFNVQQGTVIRTTTPLRVPLVGFQLQNGSN